MKHLRIITALVACAACSSEPDITAVPPTEVPSTADGGSQGNQSGSRLRRIDRVGSDESREFAGWYDFERDEDCAFTTVSSDPESIRRCLPIRGDLHESGLYIDSSCSTLVDRQDAVRFGRRGSPLRSYRVYGMYSGEVWGPHIYVHGAVQIEASQSDPKMIQFYTQNQTGCHLSNLSEVTRNLVRLDEISFDDFVSWNESVDGL